MSEAWASRWVKVNGIRTHYLEAGDGPPVVLVHGGGPGSSGQWGWFHTIPDLSKHFRVLAIDQLGFGETEKPAHLSYSHQDRVDHLAAFVDVLCLAPVNLVGNSMGAYTIV
ncbi:MAG: alpha/beta fold hydrolase, partial [Chloroflexi bacterium]|nr:alpha/beta fold hydrolase [Chloroflexota bacterium]